jgi:hypothetical protein
MQLVTDHRTDSTDSPRPDSRVKLSLALPNISKNEAIFGRKRLTESCTGERLAGWAVLLPARALCWPVYGYFVAVGSLVVCFRASGSSAADGLLCVVL